MIELKGKHNTARVFTDTLDAPTKKQICALLASPDYADTTVRVMPDTHAGRSSVIGLTMTLAGRVSPSLVGVDIGCGMEVVRLSDNTDAPSIDLPMLDDFIHRCIPAGGRLRDQPTEAGASFPLEALHCYRDLSPDAITRARLSIGTLGGGNHFIELDRGPEGTPFAGTYLVIHSGSRSLGAAVANRYRDIAYRECCQKARRDHRAQTVDNRASTVDLYDTMRFGVDAYGDNYTENRYNRIDIPKADRRSSSARLPVKWENAVLRGHAYTDYLHDQQLVVSFAEQNRRIIADAICRSLGISPIERFSCVHNYIDKNGILRKGAISARLGERVFIPLSGRDGAFLGRGLGNPDWNHSAPHGAGRACSRSDARHAYDVDAYVRVLQEAGVYTTTATKATLDECPMAYKSPDRIRPYLDACMEIDAQLRPIYNFKAAE